jgi:hypothetical protein
LIGLQGGNFHMRMTTSLTIAAAALLAAAPAWAQNETAPGNTTEVNAVGTTTTNESANVAVPAAPPATTETTTTTETGTVTTAPEEKKSFPWGVLGLLGLLGLIPRARRG